MKCLALGALLFGALPLITIAQTSEPGDLERAFDNARYGIESDGSGLRATNAANRFSVNFSGAQTTIDTDRKTEITAYLFTRSGTIWTQQKELIAADATSQCCHSFGDAVALSSAGTAALVGDDNGVGIGSAYWFNLAAGFIPLPAQKIYLSTTENNGSSSGWLQEGTWTPTQ